MAQYGTDASPPHQTFNLCCLYGYRWADNKRHLFGSNNLNFFREQSIRHHHILNKSQPLTPSVTLIHNISKRRVDVWLKALCMQAMNVRGLEGADRAANKCVDG